jgi:hypothetical protein
MMLVRSAKFVARTQMVIVGSDDGHLRVFNYNTAEEVKNWKAHEDYIRCLVVHPTLPYVLSSADDRTISLWDWEKVCQVTTTAIRMTPFLRDGQTRKCSKATSIMSCQSRLIQRTLPPLPPPPSTALSKFGVWTQARPTSPWKAMMGINRGSTASLITPGVISLILFPLLTTSEWIHYFF